MLELSIQVSNYILSPEAYMKRLGLGLSCFTLLAFAALPVLAQAPRTDGAIELSGDMAEPEQLSGVTSRGELLIVCPDEGAEFNVFQHVGRRFELTGKVSLLEDGDQEIDMEGAASDSEYVYIVGSHSIRRRLIDEHATYKQNRKRLTRIAPHSESYSLYRLKLDEHGQLIDKERIDLRDVLEADDVLGSFFAVPGKENGIDIEGIAVEDGMLYVGFRGPVLRGNFVPVISFEFEQPHDYELNFVQLEGRGVRDMVAVDGGFLILAGPVGDGDTPFELYFWNGQDCVPGDGGADGYVSLIGEIPANSDIKPEGMAVLAESEHEWRLLIVRDGERNASTYIAHKAAPLRGGRVNVGS
jgi:hypothetical protein